MLGRTARVRRRQPDALPVSRQECSKRIPNSILAWVRYLHHPKALVCGDLDVYPCFWQVVQHEIIAAPDRFWKAFGLLGCRGGGIEAETWRSAEEG